MVTVGITFKQPYEDLLVMVEDDRDDLVGKFIKGGSPRASKAKLASGRRSSCTATGDRGRSIGRFGPAKGSRLYRWSKQVTPDSSAAAGGRH